MDQPTAHQWKRMIEQGGDASIGAAVRRFAHMAARVHMFEAARPEAEYQATEGAVRRPMVHAPLPEHGATDHTEVIR